MNLLVRRTTSDESSDSRTRDKIHFWPAGQEFMPGVSACMEGEPGMLSTQRLIMEHNPRNPCATKQQFGLTQEGSDAVHCSNRRSLTYLPGAARQNYR
jgi:hypothetical protein